MRSHDLKIDVTGATGLAAMGERAPTDEQRRFCYHWPDSEPALVEPDLEIAGPFSDIPRGNDATPWGSATMPLCAITMMGEGAVAAEAAAIDVPVLIACGERDVCPDPWAEPAGYHRSSFVSVRVIPRMAHMHNFAHTHRALWDAVEHFARGVPINTATED